MAPSGAGTGPAYPRVRASRHGQAIIPCHPLPTGTLDKIFLHWAHHERRVPSLDKMAARLKRMTRLGFIETDPQLPRRWWLEVSAGYLIRWSGHGTLRADAVRYRVLKPNCRLLGPKAMPDADAPAKQPLPVPSKAGKVPGKHYTSPVKAKAEAVNLLDSIAAYQKEHRCTQEKAREALYRELGHNSAGAVKMAISRARRLLKKCKDK